MPTHKPGQAQGGMKTSRLARDTERIIGTLSVTSRTKPAHDVAVSGSARRVTRSSTSTSSSRARSNPSAAGSLSGSNATFASVSEVTSTSGSLAEKEVGSESQQQQQQPARRLSARVKGYKYQVDSFQKNGSTAGSDAASGSGASVSKKRKRQSQSSPNQENTPPSATAAAAATKKRSEQNDFESSATYPPDNIVAASSDLSSQAQRKPPRNRVKRQPAKRISGANGSTLRVDPPARWEEMYSLTEQMRARILAPVDTMGSESLAEEKRSPRDKRFQTLVALMLSSQTKDTVTAVAMRNLQESLPGVRTAIFFKPSNR